MVVITYENARETCGDGRPKILRKCPLPLTAKGHVDLIITEKCVMEKRAEGLVLTELASGVTLSDVMESIDAELIISISLAQEQRGPSKR
jgi:acyl CoA:acetate/3-ketoacid CoA transferase beta subunit